MTDIDQIKPDYRVSVREVFGIDSDLLVPAFDEREDHVPEIDDACRFNADVYFGRGRAILERRGRTKRKTMALRRTLH